MLLLSAVESSDHIVIRRKPLPCSAVHGHPFVQCVLLRRAHTPQEIHSTHPHFPKPELLCTACLGDRLQPSLQDFLILLRGLCGLINRLALGSDFKLTRGRSSESSFFIKKKKVKNSQVPSDSFKWQISPVTETQERKLSPSKFSKGIREWGWFREEIHALGVWGKNVHLRRWAPKK